MSEMDTAQIESTDRPSMPRSGLGLISIALILPVISGVVQCIPKSYSVSLGISAFTVIVTAALVAIDARRLGKVDLKGRERESAALLFVAMLALWIFVYPWAFFRRNAFTAPNLSFVALPVAIFSIAAPFVASKIFPASLPTCSSEEVAQILEQIIQGTTIGAVTTSIAGHRELSYDETAQVRQGECIVHTTTGEFPVLFFVEWQDRNNGIFQVRLPEPELPACTSDQVVQLLEEAIPPGIAGTTTSIDGHRELRYDTSAQVRYGECIAHTDSGDITVQFIVAWQDRSRGMFQVQILSSTDEQERRELVRRQRIGTDQNLKFIKGREIVAEAV